MKTHIGVAVVLSFFWAVLCHWSYEAGYQKGYELKAEVEFSRGKRIGDSAGYHHGINEGMIRGRLEMTHEFVKELRCLKRRGDWQFLDRNVEHYQRLSESLEKSLSKWLDAAD